MHIIFLGIIFCFDVQKYIQSDNLIVPFVVFLINDFEDFHQNLSIESCLYLAHQMSKTIPKSTSQKIEFIYFQTAAN